MRRLGTVAVGLALVVGIVVGGIVGNPFDGKASASTAAVGGRLIELGTQEVGYPGVYDSPLVDVSDCWQLRAMAKGSQPGGNVSFVGVASNTSPDGVIRVLGASAQDPVYGWDAATYGTASALITGPNRFLSLRVSNGYGAPQSITGWLWCVTSPSYAVGGFAELPALAGTDGPGMGSATYAVLAGAAAGVLAFAVLATLAVKRRGIK